MIKRTEHPPHARVAWAAVRVLMTALSLAAAVGLAQAQAGLDVNFAARPVGRAAADNGFGGGDPPRDVDQWLDTSSRATVGAAYQSQFLPSVSVPMAWTGNTALGTPGTTSGAYRDAVVAQINWYRAMAGVPATVVRDSVNETDVQAGALMLSANRELSSNPPVSWTHYSAGGAFAAANSIQCLRWDADPADIQTGCIRDYVRDWNPPNHSAAQRSRLLDPKLVSVVTGDVPRTGDAASGYPAANMLWPTFSTGSQPATRDPYIAWPPRGFFPFQLISTEWSFGYANADFSNATVTMTSGGNPVATVLRTTPSGGAGSTLVWSAFDAVPMTVPVADVDIAVVIGNVRISGVPQTFSYTTTIFNPFGASPTTCTNLSATPSVLNVVAGASSATIGVSASPSGCPWAASSPQSWISPNAPANGAGSGSFGVSFAANTTPDPRSGVINVGGQTVTVNQAAGPGAPCASLILSPPTLSLTAPAQVTSAVVGAPISNCTWSAVSASSWISISGPSSGVGSGSLGLSVTTNSSTASRAGTVNVNGFALSVIQTGTAAANPTLRWQFEDSGRGAGQTLTDAGVNGINGVTDGVGTVVVPGVAGQARMFNGATDGAVFGGGATALPAGAFTVRAWIRVRSWPGSYGVIFSSVGSGPFDFRGYYLAVASNGRLVFMAASQTPSSAPWMVSHAALRLEKWHHVALAFDPLTGLANMYIDGALDHSVRFNGFTPNPGANLDIGRAGWYPGAHLDYAIDELAVFPGLFDDARALSDFNQYTPPAQLPNVNTSIAIDFNAGLTDTSGNGNQAVNIGGVYVPGVVGAGLSFNGLASRVEMPTNDTFTPSLSTTRFWVKLNAYPGNFAVMVGNYGGQLNGWFLGVYQNGKIILSPAATPTGNPWILSNTTLALDRWYHITVTYQASTRWMTLYVDGTRDILTWTPGITPQVEGMLKLGGASWYNGAYLNGTMDEFRIDKRMWTQSEILQDFQSFPAP